MWVSCFIDGSVWIMFKTEWLGYNERWISCSYNWRHPKLGWICKITLCLHLLFGFLFDDVSIYSLFATLNKWVTSLFVCIIFSKYFLMNIIWSMPVCVRVPMHACLWLVRKCSEETLYPYEETWCSLRRKEKKI